MTNLIYAYNKRKFINKDKWVVEVVNKNTKKIVGQFDIVMTNCGKPSMSIEVNDDYQGLGISKNMISKLIESLTYANTCKLKNVYIDTNASYFGNGTSFWEKVGVEPGNFNGWEGKATIGRLYRKSTRGGLTNNNPRRSKRSRLN